MYNIHTQKWCLTSTETIRLIRDGEKGWGGGSMEDALMTAPFQPTGATDRWACNRAVSGPCSAEPGKEARGAWPITLAE